MVQHAATGGHAAGRQDHHRAVAVGQGLGLLGGFHHRGGVRHGLHLARAEAVVVRVLGEQVGGVHGHRAVQEHRQAARDGAL
jgi:hypothetical protein